MKKFLTAFLIFSIMTLPIYSAEEIKNVKKFNATISSDFEPNNFPEYIQFKIDKEISENGEIIPADSELKVKVIEAQPELRWHKSGLILCKVTEYSSEGKVIDISDKNIYLVARRYEPLNKKDAAILTTEIIVFSGVSIFAPGVDVGYFFLKGLIQGEKHENRFIAGVHNAYDNSLFWFPQKGKNINLKEGEEVYIKPVKSQKKVDKITKKITKRKYRVGRQLQNKNIKAEQKQVVKEMKAENKRLKTEQKQVLKEMKEESKKLKENL